MGLDMYLYTRDKETKDDTQIGYWRKFNALHNYICDELKHKPNSNCEKLYLSEKQINDILNRCHKIKEILDAATDKKIVRNGAEVTTVPALDWQEYPEEISLQVRKLLNPTRGFFWGEDIVDSYYLEDVENTIEYFTKAKYNFKEIAKKAFETKKKRGHTNTSKPQKHLTEELKDLFGEDNIFIEYNKDLRYPFHCDVYIKSIDMFVELNLYFTHGGHPFNKDDSNDLCKLNKWKSKSTKSDFYKNAIKVWTELDPLKQEIATKNNLNYIMLYSEKALYEFIHNLKEKYKNED